MDNKNELDWSEINVNFWIGLVSIPLWIIPGLIYALGVIYVMIAAVGDWTREVFSQAKEENRIEGQPDTIEGQLNRMKQEPDDDFEPARLEINSQEQVNNLPFPSKTQTIDGQKVIRSVLGIRMHINERVPEDEVWVTNGTEMVKITMHGGKGS